MLKQFVYIHILYFYAVSSSASQPVSVNLETLDNCINFLWSGNGMESLKLLLFVYFCFVVYFQTTSNDQLRPVVLFYKLK